MSHKFCISIFVIITFAMCLVVTSFPHYQEDITFVFYDENNFPIYKSNSLQDSLTENTTCDPTKNLTIIVHGWTENCDTEWIPELIKNVNTYRPGCIVCMNYYNYSKAHYFNLVGKFDGIAEVLTNKLRQFNGQGFDPGNFYLFGFSFGAHLVIEAGRRFGVQQIANIDACEPAGPGFDRNSAYQKLDPKIAAKNVQCIHTSSDKGTSKRNCHQDWNMGNCGRSQAAAGPKPKGSHGLCPYFYNSAFSNNFLAVNQSKECSVTSRICEEWPEGFKMGMLEYRKGILNGCELYANTYKLPPYNTELIIVNQV